MVRWPYGAGAISRARSAYSIDVGNQGRIFDDNLDNGPSEVLYESLTHWLESFVLTLERGLWKRERVDPFDPKSEMRGGLRLTDDRQERATRDELAAKYRR
jgi:hypothetical protein